eukprot:CAMPEP_0179453790 /NCGR_PEP_ID=MMETSP0799-20121207/37693_1 /TAXON_ID=46947 /ORGANISM="Geminigera cryophila, Strain CCMP2564" /LENGTH=560 /DNA_ID=CAMNT_0021251099 /DNA_START=92 /DNA_END=1771 /DNA_ORIENTATION=+
MPEPKEWTNGTQTLPLCSVFRIVPPSPSSPDLEDMIARYRTLITPRKPSTGRGIVCAAQDLGSLELVVSDPSAVLGLSTDESYSLFIPPQSALSAAARQLLHRHASAAINSTHVDDMRESFEGSAPASEGRVAKLWAKTQIGALRGLETFSQLVKYDFQQRSYVIRHAPWLVIDSPRFPHREVLVDSSRHFLPVATLKGLISSLPYAKINVLHWHIVDHQSFPMDSPSNPLLSERGAYSDEERYTTGDLEQVIHWARIHGVRVVPEIDVPGHASSWCLGYPQVCPSKECTSPLSPIMPTPLTPTARDTTFELLARVMDDVTGVFPENFLHLGHDEVNCSCWEETQEVRQWMLLNANLSSHQALQTFLLRAQSMAAARHRTVVAWDEAWEILGTNLPKDTVVQQWRWGWDHINTTKRITDAGFRVLWVADPTWYLDSLEVTWDKEWQVDICEQLTRTQCSLVLGGGGAMWGEHVDSSNIESIIWPRLAAVAEALWSPKVSSRTSFVIAQNVKREGEERMAAARIRLKAFRCLLNRRGVRAAPVDNTNAGTAPPGPGACMAQ